MATSKAQSVAKAQAAETHVLGQFVEDNHKLLTVLGAFTAMTVFSANLPVKGLGVFLAFLFMALSLLVWLELWSRFPSGTGHWRLTLFENLLTLTVFALLFYWLVDFRDIWQQGLRLLLWVLFLGAASAILKRFDLFNRVFRTGPGGRITLRRVFGIGLVILAYVSSFFLAELASRPINRFLDAAAVDFSKPDVLQPSPKATQASQSPTGGAP